MRTLVLLDQDRIPFIATDGGAPTNLNEALSVDESPAPSTDDKTGGPVPTNSAAFFFPRLPAGLDPHQSLLEQSELLRLVHRSYVDGDGKHEAPITRLLLLLVNDADQGLRFSVYNELNGLRQRSDQLRTNRLAVLSKRRHTRALWNRLRSTSRH